MSHLPQQCAEETQALPKEDQWRSWPCSCFWGKSFSPLLGSRQESAGQVMHAWVAQGGREGVISGKKYTLVRTKSISQGGSCCAAALVVLPTYNSELGFTLVSRRPLCQSVTRDQAWLSCWICTDKKKRLNSWSSFQPLFSSSIFPGARNYHCNFLLSNLRWIFWPAWISDEVHRPPDNCPHYHLGCTTSV